jgi:glycosyltransferase involved in cell wall biosynthesis
MVVVAAALNAGGHAITLVARPRSRLLLAARRAAVPAVSIGFRSDLDPITFLRLRRLLDRTRAQLVVNTFDKELRLSGLAALSLGRRRPIRVLSRKGLPLIADNWRYRMTYAHLVDGILTPAAAIQRQLAAHSWLEVPIQVIPNGVDLERFAHAPRRQPLPQGSPILDSISSSTSPDECGPLILCLARLSGQKGHRFLLEAAAALRTRFPRARYLLVGDGAERRAIEEGRRRLGLETVVHLIGHRQDSAELLAASDIVVLPSLDEGYPNVLLEAMAIGRPVVATRVGDASDIVVDGVTGFLVPPARSEPLADRLARLLADRDLRVRLGAAGRERAEREFAAGAMVAAVEDYFRRQLVAGER